MEITIVEAEPTVFNAGSYNEDSEENWFVFAWVPAGEGFPEYTGYMGPFYDMNEAEAYAVALFEEGATSLFDA